VDETLPFRQIKEKARNTFKGENSTILYLIIVKEKE
jgi:hypothetical protein